MTPASRTLLVLATFLVAAMPLAGCGNKGPLILAPGGAGSPPPDPVETPVEAATVAPAAASTVPSGIELDTEPAPESDAPPAEPPASTDGTPGSPR